MTEKGKETLDKAKDLVKKAAGAVTPGDRSNREYFSNLIKQTTQRSEKALLRRRRTTEIKDILR